MRITVASVLLVIVGLLTRLQSADGQCIPSTRPLTLSPNGSLTTPNYPLNYGDNSNCEWRLTAPDGKVVVLIFEYFHLERNFDFVYLHDGYNSNSLRFAVLTGNLSTSTHASTQQHLYIRFISDDSNTFKGFSAVFHMTDFYQCPSSVIDISGNGTLTSPNFPSNYGNMARCKWRATAPVGQTIRTTFDEFSTESYYDYVTLRDGYNEDSQQIAQLSGNNISIKSFSTTQQYMFIYFFSDGSATRKGFTATIESISVPLQQCPSEDVILRGSGSISSPNFPSDYYNDADCRWLLTALSEQVVKITFTDFRTETNYDYVHIYDGSSSAAGNLITSLSGNLTTPVSYRSLQSNMFIRFLSDRIITARGFSAYFESIGNSTSDYPTTSTTLRTPSDTDYPTTSTTLRTPSDTDFPAWVIIVIVCASVSILVSVVTAIVYCMHHKNHEINPSQGATHAAGLGEPPPAYPATSAPAWNTYIELNSNYCKQPEPIYATVGT